MIRKTKLLSLALALLSVALFGAADNVAELPRTDGTGYRVDTQQQD